MTQWASFDELLRQASMTAHDYMTNAATRIDEVFGEGYAKEHPTLVATFMHVAAIDYNNSTKLKVLEDVIYQFGSQLEDAIKAIAAELHGRDL